MSINILHVILNRRDSLKNLGYIPCDPRTMIKRAQLDIELTEAICCRMCFHLYKLEPTTPMHCTYKAFDNSDPCHKELFINRKLYLGYKDVGEHDYHSKPPEIPAQVIGTPQCTLLSQSILTWNTTWIDNPNSLKLSVLLFVDWFNPRGNKISGKIESTGVFALSCLNLPPSIRNKLSHMCLAGITPGPYSPDPHTFNHLLSPLVDDLIKLDAGLIILTHRSPAGRFVQVKLLCGYGDILATKKIVGYASHSATKFCSFCHAKQCDIHLLQLAKRREKDETISAAKDSKKVDSVSAQEKILTNTGVRWSELNRLTYWDPSRHVVLGFWAVSSDEAKKKRKGTYYDKPNKRRKTKGASSMDIDEDEGGIFSGSDDDDDNIFKDILLNGGLQGGFFSQDDIKCFRAGMKHVVLPPGVPHLPHNLREPKHGKLSASQWHALFVFIIPIVLLDMYLDNVGKIDLKSNLYKFLVNTAHLVQCTNVIFSRKFKPGDLKRFEMHYKKYSDTVGELFDNIKVQPNHHYSLHIPQHMTAWGPLAGVSEFAGERLIGFLQKIKTNNKIDEMHRSMMTRGCRLQRMMEKLEFHQLTQPVDDEMNPKPRQLKPIRLTESRYQLLFNLVIRDNCDVVNQVTPLLPEEMFRNGIVHP
ncbi:hypothetical protein PSTT_02351 [Puccinia striiformis]|uniref:Uncharacterized protein n=1 Tax=Puccinia striiformis TaxID=27350 RepID=A0A2S4W004_9BASI|nr:hypothetical protein PSTT_02351 [Puccinia striiformis]